MKRIIICIFALLLATPAAAGWKDDTLKEMSALMRDVDKVMKAEGFDAGSQLPFAQVVLFGMSSMCGDFTGKDPRPVPQKTINEILRAHEMILQRKTPKVETLHNIGKLCLDYMESSIRQRGVGEEAVELVGKTTAENAFFTIRAFIESEKKQ